MLWFLGKLRSHSGKTFFPCFFVLSFILYIYIYKYNLLSYFCLILIAVLMTLHGMEVSNPCSKACTLGKDVLDGWAHVSMQSMCFCIIFFQCFNAPIEISWIICICFIWLHECSNAGQLHYSIYSKQQLTLLYLIVECWFEIVPYWIKCKLKFNLVVFSSSLV